MQRLKNPNWIAIVSNTPREPSALGGTEQEGEAQRQVPLYPSPGSADSQQVLPFPGRKVARLRTKCFFAEGMVLLLLCFYYGSCSLRLPLVLKPRLGILPILKKCALGVGFRWLAQESHTLSQHQGFCVSKLIKRVLAKGQMQQAKLTPQQLRSLALQVLVLMVHCSRGVL